MLDTKAPRGKKASPEDSARHVDPGAKLKVWASERLAPSTVKASTVKLTQDGDPVAAKVSYVAKKSQVVVDPKQALEPGTYRLKVTTQGQGPGRQPVGPTIGVRPTAPGGDVPGLRLRVRRRVSGR